MHTRTHTHKHTHAHTCTHMHTHAHTCTHMHTHTSVHTHCTHPHSCAHTNTYTCSLWHAYTRIHKHKHTYRHTKTTTPDHTPPSHIPASHDRQRVCLFLLLVHQAFWAWCSSPFLQQIHECPHQRWSPQIPTSDQLLWVHWWCFWAAHWLLLLPPLGTPSPCLLTGQTIKYTRSAEPCCTVVSWLCGS